MYRRAMEELDLYVTGLSCTRMPSVLTKLSSRYLPSYPYQDNPVLHIYAGLIALYLAQPPGEISEETTCGPFIHSCQPICSLA